MIIHFFNALEKFGYNDTEYSIRIAYSAQGDWNSINKLHFTERIINTNIITHNYLGKRIDNLIFLFKTAKIE